MWCERDTEGDGEWTGELQAERSTTQYALPESAPVIVAESIKSVSSVKLITP